MPPSVGRFSHLGQVHRHDHLRSPSQEAPDFASVAISLSQEKTGNNPATLISTKVAMLQDNEPLPLQDTSFISS